MDPKPQPQPQQQNEQENSGSAKGSFLCRQSSTRWTPTTEQIRILKDLYYNNGVRSPSAEQIQEISARLRQYGKIEGKNVFYWFQNYKARERQKKRFINTDLPMQRPEDSAHKYHNITSAGISAPSPSAANIYTVQQMGNYASNAGSFTSEKSFRNCASGVDGSMSQNLGWVGGRDPYNSSYTTTLFGKKNSMDDSVVEEAAPGIETLPLFPMHGEDNMKLNPSTFYSGSWYGSNDGNAISWASLELRLNSYSSRSN